MTNCIFYAIFFAMFLNTSLGSLRFSQINRTFLSIYKGMLEACVLTINDKGEPIKPYYNKEKVESYVVTYLKKNISRYATDYLLETKYYDENFTKETTSFIRGISIKLKAKVNVMYNYEKEQRFFIQSRENL